MEQLFNFINDNPMLNIPDNTLTRILSEYITAQSLTSYLQEILLNENRINSIAKYSYVHQLGFEKYVLLSPNIKNTISLRMHIWTRNAVTPFEGEIHDHCHNFTSKVLKGALRHKFFILNEKNDGYSFYKYEINNRTKVSKQLKFDSVGADFVSTFDVQEGTTYSLTSEQLHLVEVLTPVAVTLLVQGIQNKPYARVLKACEINTGQIEGIGIGELLPSDVKRRFESLIYLLNNNL
jgi:hypothetical protein